ncbi:MAG: sigma 54-interacting transcriptional regulator [Firmicutes bacterium]|nr:sigma 54-interacting transcriptional regulator [Bacillota bacterium]
MNLDNMEKFELILDHIPGALYVDTEGIVKYLNEQCAKYIGVNLEWALGKDILEVFPETRMMENMYINRPKIVFYHSFGAGISVNVPVFLNGERVGLLEYDVVQASEVLYELSDNYTKFLDEELHSLRREINELRGGKYSIDDILGQSEVIDKLKEDIRSAALSDATVLIYGETGTGKELVAHAIHNMSRRSKNNFVKMNAANLPESLAESELFGYEGGSFTGARKEGMKGKFEQADNGTLFIDEINQMSYAIQPKLLRALQENEIEKIGSDKSISIDARVVATTNQDMRKLVKDGKFRQDLFYRLHVILIIVPPLRQRKEDIPILADDFIKKYSRTVGKTIRYVDDDVYKKLKSYDWPGNVRELQNVIERAIAFSKGGRITAEDVELPGAQKQQDVYDVSSDNPIDAAKKKAEREIIIQVLNECNGNKTKAAGVLKISRPLLYQKMNRLGL